MSEAKQQAVPEPDGAEGSEKRKRSKTMSRKEMARDLRRRRLAGEVDPAEALRRHFEGTGWEEDARLAADGPGTTAFAFRKSGISCRAEGGAHAGIEDGKPFRSDRYELTVECTQTE